MSVVGLSPSQPPFGEAERFIDRAANTVLSSEMVDIRAKKRVERVEELLRSLTSQILEARGQDGRKTIDTALSHEIVGEIAGTTDQRLSRGQSKQVKRLMKLVNTSAQIGKIRVLLNAAMLSDYIEINNLKEDLWTAIRGLRSSERETQRQLLRDDIYEAYLRASDDSLDDLSWILP